MAALSISILLGFVALAVEAAAWETNRLTMQAAADQAVLAASFITTGSSNFTTEAKGVAAANGFTNGQASTTVTVNQPPSTGNYTSNSSAIEVIITQSRTRLFSSLFLSGKQALSARSVAAPPTQPLCLLTLDPSSSGTINASGSATITASNCNLLNNSTSSTDTTLSGGAKISALNITLAGNYTASGGSSLTASGTLKIDGSTTSDPYASRTIPAYSGCSSSSGTYTGTINATTGTPYVFCNGLTASGALTLGAGVYIIDGGNLNVPGGTSLTATSGTTIILTSSSGKNYGNINISGSGTISITAPSSGATAGMALWIDKNAPFSKNNNFSGNTNETINGAIYMPSQAVTYSGGTQNTAGCTQLIAYQVNFTGSATFAHNCTGIGVSDPSAGAGSAKLVE